MIGSGQNPSSLQNVLFNRLGLLNFISYCTENSRITAVLLWLESKTFADYIEKSSYGVSGGRYANYLVDMYIRDSSPFSVRQMFASMEKVDLSRFEDCNIFEFSGNLQSISNYAVELLEAEILDQYLISKHYRRLRSLSRSYPVMFSSFNLTDSFSHEFPLAISEALRTHSIILGSSFKMAMRESRAETRSALIRKVIDPFICEVLARGSFPPESENSPGGPPLSPQLHSAGSDSAGQDPPPAAADPVHAEKNQTVAKYSPSDNTKMGKVASNFRNLRFYPRKIVPSAANK